MKLRTRCAICHDEIESTHRHHMDICKCGHSFVDGGNDYLRAGGDIEIFKDGRWVNSLKEDQSKKEVEDRGLMTL